MAKLLQSKLIRISSLWCLPAWLALPFLIFITACSNERDSQATQPNMEIRPGDYREGYESSDFQTQSTSLLSRKGHDADLLKVFKSPPLGLPPIPVPKENPIKDNQKSVQKIQLGRKLFNDRRLSINNTISCAMCHIAEQGFAQNELKNPVGLEGRAVRRNAPTIYNTAYMKHLFHDGREFSLENQVWQPFLHRDEMGNLSVGMLIERLRSLSDYDDQFEQVFGQGPDIKNIGMAIASYERALVSGNSPFDRWFYKSDEKAISEAAKRGFDVFRGKGKCVACHTVTDEHALFTDQAFHNTGVGYFATMRPENDALEVLLAPGTGVKVDPAQLRDLGAPQLRDLGRYEVTLLPSDRWRYRTPSLRNIALTAPYMHDGSLSSLSDVLQFYNLGGVVNEELDPLIIPLSLTNAELEDLLAFLQTLTGSNVEELVLDAFAAPTGGG